MAVNFTSVLWALAMAVATAALVTVCSWPFVIRQRRRHEQMIREAVNRMCARPSGEPTRFRALSRDVVEILVRQEECVTLMARTPRSARVGEVLADRQDVALLVSADAVTAPLPNPRRDGVPGNGGWRAGDLPRAADHPVLAQLLERAQRVTERCIVRARLVLAQAARLGDIETKACRDRVTEALNRADEELREVRRLAGTGAVLTALTMVTWLDLPIPEEGVPGQADIPELRALANGLARFTLRHRAALTACQPDEAGAFIAADGEEKA